MFGLRDERGKREKGEEQNSPLSNFSFLAATAAPPGRGCILC
jgi:hypothetical protein